MNIEKRKKKTSSTCYFYTIIRSAGTQCFDLVDFHAN